MRRLPIFVLSFFVLCLSGAGVTGQSVGEFLKKLDDRYRPSLQTETEDPEQADRSLQLPAGFTNEAGVVDLSEWSLKLDDGSEAVLTVTETADSLGAYALYGLWPHQFESLDFQTGKLSVGNWYSASEAVFWKGPYFFRMRPQHGSLSEPAFIKFGDALTRAIPFQNLLPVTVSHLPQKGMEPDSQRFYLGPAWLKSNPRFPEPLLGSLGLDERIEIAYAAYQPGNTALFLIGYPTVKMADDYLVRLQRRLESYFSAEGVYMKRSGLLVCIFIGNEAAARDVLSAIKYSPAIQWLHDDKEKQAREGTITFLGLITKAILGTGTMLLLIIGTGVLAGLLRYGVLRRFPGISRKKEMIRLGLE